ncbi:MMPL family transporter [Streptomyces sp. NBC_01335]|uniref:MMPL family transporter n=1 Tax=Streptomyces sp. NBC_01335 TaxID=2903828 RepID=UPI002E112F2D|nr:MMPL family transporter [Streptomyces sp. NBC_01335]
MSVVESPQRLGGWTRFVTARPRLALLAALVFTALAVFAGSGAGDRMGSGGWEAPDAESAWTTRALEKEFPASQPNLLLLIDSGRASVDDPAVVAEASRLTARLAAQEGVTGVGSYWQSAAPALRSRDGREALIAAHIAGEEKGSGEILDRIAPLFEGEHGPVKVSVGGLIATRHEMQSIIQEDLLRAETVALPVTLVLLVMVFGSAVAALLPLGVGIMAILGTSAVLRGITELTDVSVFAQNLTTALGLGLAVDYALFIVRRFREEMAAGADPRSAVGITLRTAGRTVLFSALAVAVSLSAMLVFPQYFLRSFAYAGIVVVILAAGAALIVLPAALVLLGPRVDALDLRRALVRRRGGREVPPRTAHRGRTSLAALVMRRAPVFALVTTAALVLLGLPFLGVRFGMADDRQLPADSASRMVQDHIREVFPGSPGGGLALLVREPATPAQYTALRERIAATEGVARVDGPLTAGDFATYSVVPEGEAAGPEAQKLVHDLRALDAPVHASVTGTAAVLVDSKDAIAERLPWAVGIIAVVTLLLVFLLTGSVLIPVQAVVLNALSLTAMFGAVVWVFQEGHLSGLLSFTSTGDIETTLPVLMFCVAFGLSMDYGVFLLSRIKEEYDRSGDHEGSIAVGLRHTGGLITAAAVILAVVMVAIGASRVTNTKMLGLGIALAVLMDAMVVRSLLVPSVMKVMGRATWWAPAPLRALHRRFGLDERAVPAPSAQAKGAVVSVPGSRGTDGGGGVTPPPDPDRTRIASGS